MRISKRFLLIAFFILGIASISNAQDSLKKSSPVRFLIKGALEFGGDDVAEVYFTNGESQTVNAGQGGSIAVGAQLQVPGAEKLLIHATVGYKYLTTAADNVHIRLTRVPIHLIANYMLSRKLRIGGGLVTHRSINFNSGGLGGDLSFKPATGAIAEFSYSGIGLSYTLMKYTDEEKNTYSANNIGLFFTYAIPGKKK